MKKPIRKETKVLFKIIGQYLKRHSILLIVILSAILVANIIITVSWYVSPDETTNTIEIAFYTIQAVLFLASLAAIILLIFVKLGKIGEIFLAVFSHVYATFLIAWATIVLCADLSLGFSPLTYLIIACFVAGIFVIDPFYFAIIEILSMIPAALIIARNHEIFFGQDYFIENIVLFAIFVALVILICFRNYRVIYSEYKVQQKLHEMSYKDELTGLLNERSYIDVIEDIDKRIKAGEDVKFAVVLMDVNNLKATNDAYGHRYGCSLVVRCGHTLPTIFNSSKIFHVGGDEFITIVMGEDLDKFEETMENFDKAMLYSLVEYEGQQLIFSVARGFHIREEGQFYKDVLQIADNEMYTNKKYLKEKYNMKGR